MTDHEDRREPLGLWQYVTYFVLVAVTIGVTFIFFPSIPGHIPQYYSFTSQSTQYIEKSVIAVLVVPMIQLVIALLFLGIAWGTNRASRITLGSVMFWLGLAIMLLVSAAQFTMIGLFHS
ncbi:MAG: hypothetical protein FWG78_04720 [Coriobacteriia bacterium]|nr:hypothetical protein [Coriobacteriia bacterium]